MATLIVRRLLALPVLLIGVSMVVFAVSHSVPGDPARVVAGPFATETDVERLRTQYGLDRPLVEQYLSYIGRLLQGDSGKSFRSQRPVIVELGDRLPATIELTLAALAIGTPLGFWLGLSAARRHNGLADNLATLGSIVGISVPLFWIGLMLAALFGVTLQWLPFSGRTAAFTDLPRVTGLLVVDSVLANDWATLADGLKHLILPTLTLAVVPLALVSRTTRAAYIEVLRQDYIRTARAYGVSEPRIMRRHAARNAILPGDTAWRPRTQPSEWCGFDRDSVLLAWCGHTATELDRGPRLAVISGAALCSRRST